MFKLGLTGGIGSGKSTVAKLFADRGVAIIDLDEISREVVQPGEPCLKSILEHFGAQVLGPNQELDRTALREIIFADPAQRQWLENLLHPAIRNRCNTYEQKLTSANETPYLIIEIPLLTDADDSYQFDRVLAVDLSEESQIQRTMQRSGIAKEEAVKILQSQPSRLQRLNLAHDVIDNQGSIEGLTAQVERLHQEYLKLADSSVS